MCYYLFGLNLRGGENQYDVVVLNCIHTSRVNKKNL